MAAPRVVIPVIPVIPVLVAEVSESKAVLAPGEAAVYRYVLVPAGELIELPIRVTGKDVAMVGSWIALPKVGRNSVVEIRARAFDAFPVSTFVKSAAIEEPL